MPVLVSFCHDPVCDAWFPVRPGTAVFDDRFAFSAILALRFSIKFLPVTVVFRWRLAPCPASPGCTSFYFMEVGMHNVLFSGGWDA